MEEHRADSRLNRPSARRIGLLCCLLLSLSWARNAQAETKHFELEAGDARLNLNEFSRQADLQLLFDFRQLKGMTTQAVNGDMDPVDALRLMLRGIPLEWSFVNSRTLAITMIKPPATPTPLHWWQRMFRPAQPTQKDSLDQVVISGSSVLDEPAAVGASLIRIDRTDINNSGLTTAQDVLRTLPEVFGGGPSEDTLLGREAFTNISKGSGVNVRGLDAGATLVLLDGQRIAPSGGQGLFSDVANIPLSAIDHIDVLPDGASAKYGADAIGGVVNFVLRSNFVGAETQLADGSFPGYSLGARQFSQLFGLQWSSGSLMLGGEYYDRDALPSSDRAQASSDLRSFRGSNFNQPYGDGPGTIFIGQQSWAIPTLKNGTTLTAADLVPGTENLYDQWAGLNVLPQQSRWSAFGTVRDELRDGLEVFADSLFTYRKATDADATGSPLIAVVTNSNPFYVNPTGGSEPIEVVSGSRAFFGTANGDVEVRTGNLNLGTTWHPTAAWDITGRLGYTFENEDAVDRGLFDAAALAAALTDTHSDTAFDPFGTRADNNLDTLAGIARTGLFNTKSDLATLGVSANGVLFHAAGGDAKVTVGAEYRYQNFDTFVATVNQAGQPDASSIPARETLSRKVRAEYLEIMVPLIGADSPKSFAHRLEISFGGRSEDYSDVGQATVPKFGLLWSPLSSVSFRGTWGKAFRPPALTYLVDPNSGSELIRLPDSSSPQGASNVLVAVGTNPNLQQERARTWTLGAQLTPAAVPKLTFGLTYFNTYYADRIESPLLDMNVLNEPASAYLVTRNFTVAQRAAICSQTNFTGIAGGCLNASIQAIIDGRLQNIEHLETRGIDAIGKYAFSTSLGEFGVGFNGTYLLQYAEAQTPDSPSVELLSTQNNPLNFRFRSSFSWELRGFGASAYANYSNGYRDVLSVPSRSVRSWTTVDLQLRYQTSREAGAILGGTELAASAQNIFNRSPPFLNNPVGIGYDQENADLTGRILSLSVRKRW